MEAVKFSSKIAFPLEEINNSEQGLPLLQDKTRAVEISSDPCEGQGNHHRVTKQDHFNQTIPND